MKWSPFILISWLLVLPALYVNAQDLKYTLNEWSIKNPIEKVYVHTDRDVYFAGQTIWLKSYFLSDFKPSQDNSTLFIELLNNTSKVITKKVLPVFNAITYGQMEIPDSLSSGIYILRAYAPLMLNQDKAYLFTKPIRVFGKSSKNKQQTPSATHMQLTMHFFPEGGNLIAGVFNNVAFKITDINNSPINASGIIKNEKGQAIAKFTSMHDGMGVFAFTPQLNENYIAVLDADKKSYILPAAQANGIAVSITQTQGNIEYTLTSGNNDDIFKPRYCIAQMQNKPLLKQNIELCEAQNNYSGKLLVKNFPSGILQLTFFNKDDKPLAERLVFVDNKEYLLSAILHEKNLNPASRKLNEFSIDFADSVEGNFSIAITDADYDESAERSENIISSMLLTSDVPGYVHNPAWYFSNNEKVPQAMDLLMLTNGWRRFNWTDVVQNTLPQAIYKDPGYISLSGKAQIRGSKKSFADRDLMVWTQTSSSGPHLQMVKTDDQGGFKLDSVVFFDKAKILFSDVMGNKSKFLTVKLNTDSLYRTFNLPALQETGFNNVPTYNNLASKMQSAYFDYSRGEGLLLDNVEIEGRKLTEDELEKKYMSGLFSGGINARTINLTGQFIPQWNIFDWLVGRVPSLRVDRLGSLGDNYRLYFRQQPAQLFLDEMPLTDATMISAIPASQIAFIKIFPQFIGARGNNAAVAVYTKRYDDTVEDMETSGDITDYDGYSIIKEYYSPDYSQPAETNYRDYRLTLNWQPEVLLTGKNKIPIKFYNNDRTKRFKIIAEGVTKDSKFLMIEKTIEASK